MNPPVERTPERPLEAKHPSFKSTIDFFGRSTTPPLSNSPRPLPKPPRESDPLPTSNIDNSIIIGDSFTAGLLMAGGFPKNELRYQGIESAHLGDLKARLFQMNLKELAPSAVFVAGGRNDLLMAGTASESIRYILDNYSEIISYVNSNAPKAKVIIATVPPVSAGRCAETYARQNLIAEEANRAIRALAVDNPRVEVFDFFQLLSNDKGYFRPDLDSRLGCIHPDFKGYRVLAKELKALLNALNASR